MHHNHPIRDGTHHRQIVGYKDIGGAALLLKRGEQLQNSSLHRHIERGRDFVTQHDVGVGGEGAGDSDTLLLPAG